LPNVLRNMRIKRVAFVDEGANPDAHIRFAKNKTGGDSGGQTEPEADDGFMKRMFAAFMKTFKPFMKESTSFKEEMVRREYWDVQDEMYRAAWAYLDSIGTILFDDETQPEEKARLMRASTKEFFDMIEASTDNWSKAEATEVSFVADNGGVDVLVKMRDMLNERIEKGGSEPKKPTKKAEDEDGDEGSEEEEQETGTAKKVQKGVSQNMDHLVFDESKMTPEEKATFDDLKKRFGTIDAGDDGDEGNKGAEGAKQTEEEDVYKGLHPTVRAELERLKKFHEDTEKRELLGIAKKYELLGHKPEALAVVLKNLKDAGGTAYADMIGLMDSNLAALEKSGLFGEIGKRGDTASGDPWAKIEAAAHEIVKAKPDMRWADAVDTACMQHPELVAEYEKDRG
jgi:hypothetical protein